MRVWIDLSNSPHPLLFAPIARRLEELGHEVEITVRDHAQTVALTEHRWSRFEVIGGSSPGGRVDKGRELAERVFRLRAWARRNRPEVAVSHNSYAQIVAARALRIPAVTAMDFEHQPANHLAFRLASRILLPEAIPQQAVRRQGATKRKLRRYPGLKEALYVGDFDPDPQALAQLGLGAQDQVLVVARTPPSRALYHRMGNPLFLESVRVASEQPNVRCVVLTRFPEQVETLRDSPNCIIPGSAVDSRSLMYRADLVLGAGGTMTREAALMGVPTYTVFAGKPPAVDGWLEERGMLRRLTEPEQLRDLRPRAQEPRSLEQLRAAGRATADVFLATILGD